MFRSVMASLSLIVFMSACGASEEKITAEKTEAFATQTDDNVLRSPRFGLSIEYPKGWTTLGYEELNALVDVANDVVAAGDEELAAVMEASEAVTYNLFSISQYEQGAPVDENPNVSGLAENIRSAPGVKTGRDYFFHAKKLMAQAGPTYTFEEGYQTREIGGVQFDQMNLTLELAGTAILQSYYATKHDNYMIVIIQSYTSDEGKQATSKVIDTVELDW